MKFNGILTVLFLLTLLIPTFAQTKGQYEKTKNKNKKSISKKHLSRLGDRKEQPECLDKSRIDGLYYAKVRYVIVYNHANENAAIPTRAMDILMDPEQLNEENLKCVFKLIENRFPTPFYRIIQVHTNLATIGTPEERDYPSPSGRSRFDHTYDKYKKAYYIRYSDGREVFRFTTQLLPDYKEKEVVLVEKKSPKL